MDKITYNPILIDLTKTDCHGKTFMDAQPHLDALFTDTMGSFVIYQREWQIWYQPKMTFHTDAKDFAINDTMSLLASAIGHPLRECRTFLMGTDERSGGPDHAVFILPERWDKTIRWFVHVEAEDAGNDSGWYAVFTPAEI